LLTRAALQTATVFQVRNIGLPVQLNSRLVEIQMKTLDAESKKQELELDKIKANAANTKVTLEANRNKNITEYEQGTIVLETKEVQVRREVEELTKQMPVDLSTRSP
jgi:hypothetical protein